MGKVEYIFEEVKIKFFTLMEEIPYLVYFLPYILIGVVLEYATTWSIWHIINLCLFIFIGYFTKLRKDYWIGMVANLGFTVFFTLLFNLFFPQLVFITKPFSPLMYVIFLWLVSLIIQNVVLWILRRVIK